MPRVTAPDGTLIAYQTAGTGPPLLLLAGQSCTHEWWQGVRGDFEPHRTTVTLDYRGTGDSDKPDVPYSTPGFAVDALAVLDEMGAERADVYGTSMGGRVAQWLAARHPDRVRRLVLGCTSPGGPRAVERTEEVRRSLADPDPAKARRALLDLMYTPEWLATHPGPHGTLGDPRMPRHARHHHLVASARHDASAVLADIIAPTLVLHGTDDLLNPAANADLLAEGIRDARPELFPGARHAYFEECRDEAGKLVNDFLAA